MINTIGELISELEKANPNSSVYYDFCNASPTCIASSRGTYSNAALGFDCGGVSVEDLIEELKMSIDGRIYTGWKGGEYTFTSETPIFVDNFGYWTGTFISSVEIEYFTSINSGQVTLHTQKL